MCTQYSCAHLLQVGDLEVIYVAFDCLYQEVPLFLSPDAPCALVRCKGSQN